MKDKRLYLRVILKLMVFFSLLIMLIVLLRSFTPFFEEKHQDMKLVNINFSKMKSGEIKKKLWQGREIAVLKREKNENFASSVSNIVDHNGLNKTTRSFNRDFFVYFNAGDSGSCPLQYASKRFKDICTGKLFDTTGREKNNLRSGVVIKIPPHYFIDDRIVFGEWLGATKN